MEYSITHQADPDYIYITIGGEIVDREMKTAIQEAGKMIVEKNCNRILGDFRNSCFKMSVIAIMNLYKFWVDTLKINKISPYKAKRVILLNKNQETRHNFQFFETLTMNRNHLVRIFYDLDEGIRWLVQE